MNGIPLAKAAIVLTGVCLALLGTPLAATAGEALPSLTSIGVGWFDQEEVGINLLWFDQGSAAGTAETWSLRLDHRFGGDLAAQPWHFLELRPWVGTEVTGDGAFYGGGGGVADLHFGGAILSASLGAGLYLHGNGKDLGYPLEFRTGLEAGWAFDNGWRLTGGYYHLSNSEIRPDDNPGANTLVLYLHIPNLMAGGQGNAE